MTIEFRSKPGPVQTPTATDTNVRKSDQRSSERAPAHGSTHDIVTVTDTTALLQRSAISANDESLVDINRVTNIRRDLARGQYAPDMDRVAEKLVTFERALRQ